MNIEADIQMALPAAPAPYGRITVLGGGAWGTALAAVAAHAGRDVRLWLRDADRAQDIARTRRNSRYLRDIPLPEALLPTADLAAALAPAEAVLLVTPSKTVRTMSAQPAALQSLSVSASRWPRNPRGITSAMVPVVWSTTASSSSSCVKVPSPWSVPTCMAQVLSSLMSTVHSVSGSAAVHWPMTDGSARSQAVRANRATATRRVRLVITFQKG